MLEKGYLPFLLLLSGNIHLATTTNKPTTFIVVDVIKAIKTLSERENPQSLKPDIKTETATQTNHAQTSQKIRLE